MKKLSVAVGVLLAWPAHAQSGDTLRFPTPQQPNPCTFIAAFQCQGVGTGNPLPVTVIGGGSATRTTAAGTSDTQAVPVQGVTGGIPQRTTRADDTAIASETTLGTLFKAGQSIGNTSFGIASTGLGTSVSPLRIDPTGATPQPVTGTLTVNQGGAPWSQNLTQVGGSSVTLGQKTMAASIPVTLASDGGYATAANQPAVATAASAAPTTGTMLMGSDGTFARAVKTDASGNAISLRNAGYVEYASSSLAANAQTTATQRTPPAWATRFGCTGRSAQAGTLAIYTFVAGSVGGGYVVNSYSLTAGTAYDLSVPVRGTGNYDCVITNGSTASTDAWVISSFTAAQ